MRPAPETKKPCYEILGEIERFDQRDNPNARVYLIPGTPEYDDYYSRKPELKDWDDECRRVLAETIERQAETDPINSRLRTAVFFGKKIMGYSSFVEGTIDQQHVSWGGSISPESIKDKGDIDPEEMAKKIKGFGKYLGAAKVRITKLKQDWVQTYHSSYYGSEPYGKPVDLNYKYVICMTFPTEPSMLRSKAINVEGGWKEAYSSFISVIMAQFIRSCGWRTRALPPENAPYLAVPTFIDAGIGEQGRHGIVITKEFGSFYIPGAVATDIPLALDKPVDFGVQDFCEKCKLCAEVCPIEAISHEGKEVVRGVKRWNINGDKCRFYWSKIGRACGLCRLVCPWNHSNSWLHNSIRELSQSFPFLRGFLIKGEKIFYSTHKPSPLPDWMKTTGLKIS